MDQIEDARPRKAGMEQEVPFERSASTRGGHDTVGGRSVGFAPPYRLSAFADEVTNDPDAQGAFLQDVGVRYVDLRSAWGKNVLTLSDAEVQYLASLWHRYGVSVACIASQIGKQPFDPAYLRNDWPLRRAIQIAEEFRTRYVRVFSFSVSSGKNRSPRNWRAVADHLSRWADLAGSHGVTLLLEPEPDMVAGRPPRTAALMAAIGSHHLRLIWDSANWVRMGIERPVDRVLHSLAPYVAHVHVKDCRRRDGINCVAGAGEGQIAALLASLWRAGYDGIMTLEPGLGRQVADTHESRAAVFHSSIRALRTLMAELGWAEDLGQGDAQTARGGEAVLNT